MALPSGTRIGAYEILAKLGAGGMGEVYKARDTRLGRDVAIKALPDLFATDPERVARFEREAQLLAALNHTHIGAIYGLEEQNKSRFLILEFIEGQSLADRLATGALQVPDALGIARQMLDALEAAHDKGIVHRDLKPANVMLTTDGQVKVLDFGLAKAFAPEGAKATADATNSPTITLAATQVGVILGTAAYMAPEQAKGRTADRRSDVWAFGCVLYEMLTGKRVFDGEDVSDTLAAVLRADPDWSRLRADVPIGIRTLLKRCLERDRKARIPEIATVRFLLEDALAAPPAPAPTAPVAASRPLWKRAAAVAVPALLTGALGVGAAWYFKPSSAPPALTRFAVALPEGQAFTSTGRHMLAISPDGTQIVYLASGRLNLRSLSELEGKPIQGTETLTMTEPVFSPDGRSIAFYSSSENALKRVAVTGGAAVTICPADNPYGMKWGEDSLVFGQANKGIMRVSPGGGTPEVLVQIKEGEVMHGPQILPGGTAVLYTLATGTLPDRWDKATIVVQELKSGARKSLIAGGSDGRYLPTGHLMYALGGTLFAVAFDPRTLTVQSGPVPIIEGVRRAPGATTGAANYSFSNTGSLAYIPGPVSTSASQLDIVLADRKGTAQPLNLQPGSYQSPRVSPDGKRLAFEIFDGKQTLVWTYDLAGKSTMQRLTFGGSNRFPIWASDGKRVAFQSDREGDLGIFWQPADGTGSAERLTKAEAGESHEPASWSPDGERFLFDVRKGSDFSLWMFSVRDRKASPFGAVRSEHPSGAVFSPDGRWVAYSHTEQGKTTVHVQPFPATGARYQLFAKEGDGPHEVMWSPDGKELFYNPRPSGFEAVSVTTQPAFAFGNPVALQRQFTLGPPSARRAYDVTPDGKFVGVATAAQLQSGTVAVQHYHVVLNWLDDLKARVK